MPRAFVTWDRKLTFIIQLFLSHGAPANFKSVPWFRNLFNPHWFMIYACKLIFVVNMGNALLENQHRYKYLLKETEIFSIITHCIIKRIWHRKTLFDIFQKSQYRTCVHIYPLSVLSLKIFVLSKVVTWVIKTLEI